MTTAYREDPCHTLENDIEDSFNQSPHAAAPSLAMTVVIGAGRCRCTLPSLKRMPSASSAETTRCRARALALGTLPLDPSQAVRQGRDIEARSASSFCERPVRLRAARNMPPVISTIVMLRLFARRQRASMSAYFTNSLTPPTGLGLLASLRGGVSFGRAARGSVAPRKMACRPLAGERISGSRPSTRAQGAAWSLPLSSREQARGSNGRQDAQPCFACRPVALLRRRRLDLGSFYFGLGLFRVRCRRRSRHSREALALTWAGLAKAGLP
jgi:hypothetical protein